MDFTKKDFNISEYIIGNNLDNISRYLDYGLEYTIKKQKPNISFELEKKYAKDIIIRQLQGYENAFTKDNNIRSNIKVINNYQLIMTVIRSMIINKAFNSEVLHHLTDENYTDQLSSYITNQFYIGQGDKVIKEIMENKAAFNTLIDNYLNITYRKDDEIRRKHELLLYKNPTTEKAIEQLNLEMSLNNLKKNKSHF